MLRACEYTVIPKKCLKDEPFIEGIFWANELGLKGKHIQPGIKTSFTREGYIKLHFTVEEK